MGYMAYFEKATCIALVGVSVFVIAGTWILLKVTDFIIPLRVPVEEESEGLDLSQHGESLQPAVKLGRASRHIR